MGARENKLQKLQVSQNEIFGMTILPVFSKFLWNLKFPFSCSHKKLCLVLLRITNYIYSPSKVYPVLMYLYTIFELNFNPFCQIGFK